MDPDKLAKVLAMAESEHQGEALAALRAARIILARSGMSFKDLALAARPAVKPAPPPRPEAPPPEPPVRTPPPDVLVQGLRRQVGTLEVEVDALRRELERVTGELDKQREEADRWRLLARETAEKLWDLGKALERRHRRHTLNDKRRAILELLQDPTSALLSDREIARRVGASVQVVAHWRRRLAIVGRKVRLLPVQPRGRGLWGPAGRKTLALDGPRRRWTGVPAIITIAGRSGPAKDGGSDRTGDGGLGGGRLGGGERPGYGTRR